MTNIEEGGFRGGAARLVGDQAFQARGRCFRFNLRQRYLSTLLSGTHQHSAQRNFKCEASRAARRAARLSQQALKDIERPDPCAIAKSEHYE